MNSFGQLKVEKYAETFEKELRGLIRRREADPECTVGDIEQVLHHLYIRDGADNHGRGEMQDIIMAATIAAYEHSIAQWKADEINRQE